VGTGVEVAGRQPVRIAAKSRRAISVLRMLESVKKERSPRQQ
jgi:hypothetical protein